MNKLLLCQFFFSFFAKAIINVNKYKLSGATQRKGITEMSWLIFSVTARSKIEAHAESPSQASLVFCFGLIFSVLASIAKVLVFENFHKKIAARAHSKTKTVKPIAQ